MRVGITRGLIVLVLFSAFLTTGTVAQNRQAPDPELIAKRFAIEKELNEIAVVDRQADGGRCI